MSLEAFVHKDTQLYFLFSIQNAFNSVKADLKWQNIKLLGY